MTKIDLNTWKISRKARCGWLFVGAVVGSMRLSAGPASTAQRHLDLANIHPESTAPVRHREADTVLLSPFNYEVLFADDQKSIIGPTPTWLTVPARSTAGLVKQGSRASFQRATFSRPESPNPGILSPGVYHSVVLTGSTLLGYIVLTDPSYKNGLRIPDGSEYGQHITLAGGSLALTEVSFPYYSSVSAAQALTFSLYSVGTGGLPESLLYRSSPQNVNEGIYNVSISYAGSIVPQDLIFSVKFSGIGASANAGLLLPNADPVVGTTTGQILANQDGVWSQHSVGGGLKGAISISITGVPEPRVAILTVVGIGFLWMASRHRR